MVGRLSGSLQVSRPAPGGNPGRRSLDHLGRVGSCLLGGVVRPELAQDAENGLAVVLGNPGQQLLLEPPVRSLDLGGPPATSPAAR